MPPKYRLTKFPPNRIKKVMQQDEDIGKVVCSVPPLVSRISELFLTDIMQRSAVYAEQGAMKTVNVVHLHRVVHEDKRLEFLDRIVDDAEAAQRNQLDSGMSKLRGSGGGSGSGHSSSTSNISAMKKMSDASDLSSSTVTLHRQSLKRAFSSTEGLTSTSTSPFVACRSPRGRKRGSFKKFLDDGPSSSSMPKPVLKRKYAVSGLSPANPDLSYDNGISHGDSSKIVAKRGRGRPRGTGRRVGFASVSDDQSLDLEEDTEKVSIKSDAEPNFSSSSRLCRSMSLNSVAAPSFSAVNTTIACGTSLRSPSPHVTSNDLVIDEEGFRKPLLPSHSLTVVSQQQQQATARNSPIVINRTDTNGMIDDDVRSTGDDSKSGLLTVNTEHVHEITENVGENEQKTTSERTMALLMSFGPSSTLASSSLSSNDERNDANSIIRSQQHSANEALSVDQNSCTTFSSLDHLRELVFRSVSSGTSSISSHVANEEASLATSSSGSKISGNGAGSRRKTNQQSSSRSTPVAATAGNNITRTSRNGAASASLAHQQVFVPSFVSGSVQQTASPIMSTTAGTRTTTISNNSTTLLAAILAAQQLLAPSMPVVQAPPAPPQLSISSLLAQLINHSMTGASSSSPTTTINGSGGPSLLASPPPPLMPQANNNTTVLDSALLARLLLLQQQQQQQQQQANAIAALPNAIAAVAGNSGTYSLTNDTHNNSLPALLLPQQQQLQSANPSPLLLQLPPGLLSTLPISFDSNNNNSNSEQQCSRSPQELMLLAALNSSNGSNNANSNSHH